MQAVLDTWLKFNNSHFAVFFKRYILILPLSFICRKAFHSNGWLISFSLWKVSYFIFFRTRNIRFVWLSYMLKCIVIRWCNDIEMNPRPKLNSLLWGYLSVKKSNVSCLLKTYLDAVTLSEVGNLDIPSYILIRTDHSSDGKSGKLCICYLRSI